MYRDGLFTEEALAITVEEDSKQMAYNGEYFIYEWNARPNQLAQLTTYTQNVLGETTVWDVVSISDDAAAMTTSNAG